MYEAFGIPLKSILFADSNNLFKCLFKQKILPSYTLIPSHTASPPCDKLSKTNMISVVNKFPDIELIPWEDHYSELISAINIEKLLYAFLSYMLIIISCLGIFTINNFHIFYKLNIIY